MKLKKYMLLAALPIVFTACQDDVIVENYESGQGITTLYGIMDEGLSNSRAQIAISGTDTKKEQFMWNVGDKFTLFQTWQKGTESSLYSIHPFTISDDYTYADYGSKGKFSTDKELVDNRNYVAFYPTESLDNEEELVSFEISEDIKDNSRSSWVKYFNENMFMMSAGTITKEYRELLFKHLCGIIRITYTNATDEDQKLKGFYINGTLGQFRQFDVFNPNVLAGQGNVSRHGITFTDKALVKAGQSQDFYILFFPPTKYNEQTIDPMTGIQVDYDINNEDNKISSTPANYQGKKFSYANFEAGKCYWFKVTGVENERLVWTKDMNGDEGGDDEEEIQGTIEREVEDFNELVNALAVKAETARIKLIADIELLEPISAKKSYVELEMNGKTISLADNYDDKDSTTVIYAPKGMYITNGKFTGKEGDTPIHEYYFKTEDNYARLTLDGVQLTTGTAISNAILMRGGNLNMHNYYDEINETKVLGSITTGGNAIHWNALRPAPQNHSRIWIEINGNVKIESDFDSLNTYMIFGFGKINGKLICDVPNSLTVSDYVVWSREKIQKGPNFDETSWSIAGNYVEDYIENVDDENGLREAIDKAQIANETVTICFQQNIALTSPLTIKKPVVLQLQEKTLSLSSNFQWGTSDAVITVTSDSKTGKSGMLQIWGREQWNSNHTKNGTIQGSTSEENKYLIKNLVNKELVLGAVNITAGDELNAVYIDNSCLKIDGDEYMTNISAVNNDEENNIALYMNARTHSSTVKIYHCGVNIQGDIKIANEYKGDDLCGIFQYNNGISSIKGDLSKTGTYKNNFTVNLGKSTIEGNGWYPEVASLEDIYDAKNKGHKKMILTAPLSFNDSNCDENNLFNLNLVGVTLYLSNTFWEYNDAAIKISGSAGYLFHIDGLTIEGSTSATDKYLLKAEAEIGLSNVHLIAGDKLNAVYVKTENFNINFSNISTEDGYAFNAAATDLLVGIHIGNESNVVGNVGFNTYSASQDNDQISYFIVDRSTVSGDLSLTGDLEVRVDNGGAIYGNNWPEGIEGIHKNGSTTSGPNFGNGGVFQ